MNVGFATGQNKEMSYNTVNNKQVFLKMTNMSAIFCLFPLKPPTVTLLKQDIVLALPIPGR